MSVNPPSEPVPVASSLPEPVARKESGQRGWLAAMSPQNIKRMAKGIGHIAGVVARISDSASQTIRDNKARDTVSAAVAERVAAGIRNADPAFQRAYDRESARILREQQSLDDIAEIATDALGKRTDKDFATGELDDDWLYQFEAAAKGFTSERMKHTFARILEGEILKPGSFSPATMRVLTTLSASDANLISTFVSMAWVPAVDIPPLTPQLLTASRSPGANGLAEFGLGYANLSKLQQCGFLQHDLSTNRTVAEMVLTGVPAFIGSLFVRFLPLKDGAPDRPIRVPGLLLTTVGDEIYKVVDRKAPPEGYVTALKADFDAKHRLTLMTAS